MADVEASVRDLVNRDCDCAEQALAQINLRRRINLLIAEWEAAGGDDVLPDVRGRMRLRAVAKVDRPASVLARR